MTVWDIKPGKWRIRQGTDNNEDQVIDGEVAESVVYLERGGSVNLHFVERKYNIVSLELIEPSEKGYWDLPDLGIGPDDIKINGKQIIVKVHNIGGAKSSETIMEVEDAKGNITATVIVPPIEAPLDLEPRWKDIVISVTDGTDLTSGSVQIDPERKTGQISHQNDIVKW